MTKTKMTRIIGEGIAAGFYQNCNTKTLHWATEHAEVVRVLIKDVFELTGQKDESRVDNATQAAVRFGNMAVWSAHKSRHAVVHLDDPKALQKWLYSAARAAAEYPSGRERLNDQLYELASRLSSEFNSGKHKRK
jgi:hypothetical protein